MYLVLACVFLWRSTVTNEVFLPAGLLGQVAPYASQGHASPPPPWNPLRWDGIAQFYPWRHYAANALRSGTLPLWNPYQFCGTPFVANGQSAVFYPGNLLFYLLPTARAFGASAILHLTLAGWFLYLLVRRLGCSQYASLLGGIIYAYAAWQVSWLQLPTFLATSCWFPLLLRQVLEIGQKSNRMVPKLAGVVGMILLAGHLQIAFYGLLAGTLLAFGLLALRGRRYGVSCAVRMLGAYLGGLGLGLMLAAPQLLPSIELSRTSHRVGRPTVAGYATYTEYALSPQNLITLLLPDLYGNDHDPNNLYWGFYVKHLGEGQQVAVRHNAAETALYVGILPLVLGMLALWRGRRDPKTVYFAGLALLSLLLAFGTPLNAVFYFGIPGFSQSGSPGRVLVLWTFAVAALAAFGLDALREKSPSPREIMAAAGGPVFLFAIGLSLTAAALGTQILGFKSLNVPLLGEALGRIGSDWLRLGLMFASTLVFLTSLARRTFTPHRVSDGNIGTANAPDRLLSLPLLAVLVTLLDLFSVGMAMNPTAQPEWVYPETPGIRFVRSLIGHERIFPVNMRWSLDKAPPAVLPPNGAMVYGLRDVQGYDSLLTGRYKAFADRFARLRRDGTRDACPPEVGNMVFFQDPNAPLVPETGARVALTLSPSAPEFVTTLPPPGSPIYDSSDEMAVYALPNAQPRARLVSMEGVQPLSDPVTYVEDGPTRVTLKVNASTAATLKLADAYYPGWHAWLDGAPLAIQSPPLPDGAAGVYRAVSVPAGRHRIAFRYEPASFHVGLYLASLSLLTLGICLLSGRSHTRSQA